jgi:CHAD domain-containing protein
MAYTLKPDRSIRGEVRRLADKQLTLAIASMHAIGDPKGDQGIHEARRHVKKIRALVRLVRSSLGPASRSANKRLRRVNRLLAPVADGEAVVDTLARFDARYDHELPRRIIAAIRKGLVQRRIHIDQQARLDRVLPASLELLEAERQRVERWRPATGGFRAIKRGLRTSVREAKRAMALSLEHPTTEHYHSWRRRVKDHWFQVRLLEARCGNGLVEDERALEVLDGCLGELHNCMLLEATLTTDTLLRRQETARTLRLLRRYHLELRREAQQLGARIYRETPRQFVTRVKRAWRTAKETALAAKARTRWARAA